MANYDLRDLPDSAVAKELESGKPGRFSERLEALYLQQHLRFAHARVRLWFTLTGVLTMAFTALRWADHAPTTPWAWVGDALHVGLGLTLLWLAWSAAYLRGYLVLGRILVPLYLWCATLFIVHAIARDHPEALANLAVMVFANFFLSGLLARWALLASGGIVVTFGVSAALEGMPQALLAKGLLILTVTCSLGAFLARDMEHNRRRRFLEKALIAELVARDGLSGLKNRRAFDDHLQRLWHLASLDGKALGLLLIDIDHFKNYNDVHGHQAGDAALRAVAQVLKQFARRPLDIAARYGGEEFALVLFDIDAQETQLIAEQARQAVALTAVRELESKSAVTISVGIAHVLPTVARTPQGALQLADEALYEAKANGRNCVVFKGEEEYTFVRTGSFRKATDVAGSLAG